MPYSLLFVEDIKDVWDEVRIAFTSPKHAESFTFVDAYAPTNASAIMALKQYRPDVVLLDVKLIGDTSCRQFIEYIIKEYRTECLGAQVPFLIFYTSYWTDVRQEMQDLTMGLPVSLLEKGNEYKRIPGNVLEKISQCVLPFNKHKGDKKVVFIQAPEKRLAIAPSMVLWVRYESAAGRRVTARFVHNPNIELCDRGFQAIAKDLGAVFTSDIAKGRRSQFVIINRNLIVNVAYLLLDVHRYEISFQNGQSFSANQNDQCIGISADTCNALESVLSWWIGETS